MSNEIKTRESLLNEKVYNNCKFFEELLQAAVLLGLMEEKEAYAYVSSMSDAIMSVVYKTIGELEINVTEVSKIIVNNNIYILSMYLMTMKPVEAYNLIRETPAADLLDAAIDYYVATCNKLKNLVLIRKNVCQALKHPRKELIATLNEALTYNANFSELSTITIAFSDYIPMAAFYHDDSLLVSLKNIIDIMYIENSIFNKFDNGVIEKLRIKNKEIESKNTEAAEKSMEEEILAEAKIRAKERIADYKKQNSGKYASKLTRFEKDQILEEEIAKLESEKREQFDDEEFKRKMDLSNVATLTSPLRELLIEFCYELIKFRSSNLIDLKVGKFVFVTNLYKQGEERIKAMKEQGEDVTFIENPIFDLLFNKQESICFTDEEKRYIRENLF